MKPRDFFPAIRYFIYIIFAIGLTFLQYLLARTLHQQTYMEGGIIENLQIALLLLAALIFGFISVKKQVYRVLSFFFCGLCLLATCRELDSFFDNLLPIISWKIGFIFIIASFIYIIKNKHKFLLEIVSFIKTQPFAIMCNALILILPIGQLIGHGKFLRNVLYGFEHVNKIKEMFEESLETYGYYLIFCSAIELLFLCLAHSSQRQEEK